MKGRAVRRYGELFRQIEPGKGGQPFQKRSTVTGGGNGRVSRKQVAKDTGIGLNRRNRPEFR